MSGTSLSMMVVGALRWMSLLSQNMARTVRKAEGNVAGFPEITANGGKTDSRRRMDINGHKWTAAGCADGGPVGGLRNRMAVKCKKASSVDCH